MSTRYILLGYSLEHKDYGQSSYLSTAYLLEFHFLRRCSLLFPQSDSSLTNHDLNFLGFLSCFVLVIGSSFHVGSSKVFPSSPRLEHLYVPFPSEPSPEPFPPIVSSLAPDCPLITQLYACRQPSAHVAPNSSSHPTTHQPKVLAQLHLHLIITLSTIIVLLSAMICWYSLLFSKVLSCPYSSPFS